MRNSMITVVRIYVMMVGEAMSKRALSPLSEHGIRQVMRSTLVNLCNVNFDDAYCTTNPRSTETASIVFQSLSKTRSGPKDGRKADFSPLPGYSGLKGYWKLVKSITIDGRQPTIDQWNSIPEAIEYTEFVRDRAVDELKFIALDSSEKQRNSAGNLSVFTTCIESPSIELAALTVNPRPTIPILREVDIIKYVLTVQTINDEPEVKLANVCFLSRGF